MTKLQLAKRIASIVVYGHILLFAFGLVIMLISPYDRADTAQMILMGSPLLAMVGISAIDSWLTFRMQTTRPRSIVLGSG